MLFHIISYFPYPEQYEESKGKACYSRMSTDEKTVEFRRRQKVEVVLQHQHRVKLQMKQGKGCQLLLKVLHGNSIDVHSARRLRMFPDILIRNGHRHVIAHTPRSSRT